MPAGILIYTGCTHKLSFFAVIPSQRISNTCDKETCKMTAGCRDAKIPMVWCLGHGLGLVRISCVEIFKKNNKKSYNVTIQNSLNFAY